MFSYNTTTVDTKAGGYETVVHQISQYKTAKGTEMEVVEETDDAINKGDDSAIV